MTEDERKKLNRIESHVRQLIEKYQELKKENEDLYALVDEKEQAIKGLEQENKGLQQKYDNLKLARMLEISDNDMKNAKQRLSKLVREVDKCIALLKV